MWCSSGQNHLSYSELSVQYTLSNCDDSKNKATAMNSLKKITDVFCLYAPKRYIKIAECEIEYDI